MEHFFGKEESVGAWKRRCLGCWEASEADLETLDWNPSTGEATGYFHLSYESAEYLPLQSD